MEILFNKYRGTIIRHPSYEGVVCGYTEAHFILAVETKDVSNFWRTLKDDFFILDKYRDKKYRFIFEDESVIEQQISQQQWLKNQKPKRKARSSKKQ